MTRWVSGCVVGLALVAAAGNRARPGGTLQVAMVAPSPKVTPLTAEAPVDVTRLLLTHQLLCRLVEFSHPTSTVVRLAPLPGVESKQLAEALERVASSPAPTRGLMAPVASWAATGQGLDLQLVSSAADVGHLLCHPAFAIALGAFRAQGPQLEAYEAQPAGRPHLDALVLHATDERTAERLLSQKRVQVVVGASSHAEGLQLFVTALVLGPGLESLRPAIESTIDRADLARFFVPAPAGPLPGLLPPGLGPQHAGPLPSRPVPLASAKDVSIGFDEAAPHERAIAQRLQVKLQPLGYRLALKPMSRDALRARVAKENELVMHSLVLPPSATGALLVWLELGQRRNRIPSVLQQLAASPDPEAKARDLAVQLAAELPLVPLVTRGVGVTASPEVRQVSRDILGVPRLDDVFLSPE
jgi:peptide/nickel transport system substrate-binding protein